MFILFLLAQKGRAKSFADLFHIYTDSTFFRYEITITREDEEQGVQEERYVLHVKPLRLFHTESPWKKGRRQS